MYTEVSICINDILRNQSALTAAFQYAQRVNGTVTAVYLKLDDLELRRWQGVSPMSLASQLLTDQEQQEEKITEAFNEIADKYQCNKILRVISQSSNPIKQLICADMIMIAQPITEAPEFTDQRLFINRAILESKRPVLMVPDGWQSNSFATKTLIGWNGSAEAMRAVSDALPLIDKKNEVIVLDLFTNRLREPGGGSSYIEDYLTRKEMLYQMVIEKCDKSSVVQSRLLEYANQEKCDLVVIGGYGHSRLREFIMGGVTDHLIKHSNIPVMFSH